MKFGLREVSRSGNNLIVHLLIDDRIVSPQGLHMNPAELDELTQVLAAGVHEGGGHTFEVDDR